MIITMGKNQSKELNEQIVIAQSGANASSVETQLNQFSVIVTAVLIIMVIIIMYFLYRKCHKRAKNWVQRQAMAVTPMQGVQTITPQVASVSTTPKVKIVSV